MLLSMAILSLGSFSAAICLLSLSSSSLVKSLILRAPLAHRIKKAMLPWPLWVITSFRFVSLIAAINLLSVSSALSDQTLFLSFF